MTKAEITFRADGNLWWAIAEQEQVKGTLTTGEWIVTRNHLGFWIRRADSDFFAVAHARTLDECLERVKEIWPDGESKIED
jgi:hypothetical protein